MPITPHISSAVGGGNLTVGNSRKWVIREGRQQLNRDCAEFADIAPSGWPLAAAVLFYVRLTLACAWYRRLFNAWPWTAWAIG